MNFIILILLLFFPLFIITSPQISSHLLQGHVYFYMLVIYKIGKHLINIVMPHSAGKIYFLFKVLTAKSQIGI